MKEYYKEINHPAVPLISTYVTRLSNYGSHVDFVLCNSRWLLQPVTTTRRTHLLSTSCRLLVTTPRQAKHVGLVTLVGRGGSSKIPPPDRKHALTNQMRVRLGHRGVR